VPKIEFGFTLGKHGDPRWLLTGSGIARRGNMSSYTELEQVWQIRASRAREEYEERSREFMRLVAYLRAGRFVSSHCEEVLRQARQRESVALDEYLRALRIYTDIVLKRIVTKGQTPSGAEKPKTLTRYTDVIAE
jgi:hypothetical protein